MIAALLVRFVPADDSAFLFRGIHATSCPLDSLDSMYLAGVWVPDSEVLELADIVDEPTASELRRAVRASALVLHLTLEDRDRVLSALDRPSTDGLQELRDVLSRESEWRGTVRADRARVSAASIRARYARPRGIVCSDCGCRSETGSGWIALLGQDPDNDDVPAEVLAFCPVCAAREFEMKSSLAIGYT